MSPIIRLNLFFALLLSFAIGTESSLRAAEKPSAGKPIATAADATAAEIDTDKEGWVSLFNGKDLTGWKAAENEETFRVQKGKLVVNGERAHLFYVGKVNNAKFKNFIWQCEILTKPNSNSGMYFHTQFQKTGWPEKGYEVQVNNTHSDPRKTGGLYGIVDVMDKSPVEDNKWFTQQVTVKDNHVVVKVNGKVTAEYTEPADAAKLPGRGGRILSTGTIALQGHDPVSEVHYRNIKIKLLQ